jgi:folate-binding protein YgfZ
LPATTGAVAHLGSARLVRIDDDPARWLSLSPAAAPVGERPAGLADCATADASLWRRLAVRRGQPEVYAATSGEFVAQMLNLDVLGAIAFDKGCYTGQEVIARAHYRGRVKRRLQRFGSVAPLPLAPGAAGTLADGRTVRVVEVAQIPEGGCEFLAVAAIGAGSGEPAAAAATLRLEATPRPLPYELPE